NLATVAITVTPVNDPPVGNAGGPYVVVEGGSVMVAASATDVDGDALTFAWDLDGNGSFETPGASATFSAAGLDGPSNRVVKVQISDGAVSVVVQAIVNILNVPPVLGNLSPSATTINENDSVALSGAFSDPGTPDTHQ